MRPDASLIEATNSVRTSKEETVTNVDHFLIVKAFQQPTLEWALKNLQLQ